MPLSKQVYDLERILYACIVELSYVQSVENCGSGLCASSNGKLLIEDGMALLGVKDLSETTWETVIRKGVTHG